MDKFKIGDRIVVSATIAAEELRGWPGAVVEINEELIGVTLDDDPEIGFVWQLLPRHLDHYCPFNDNQSICEFINEF